MKRPSILLGALCLVGLSTASCTGTTSEEEAILGNRINEKAFPMIQGTGGSGVPDSEHEALLGNRANPEFLNDVHQSRQRAQGIVEEGEPELHTGE